MTTFYVAATFLTRMLTRVLARVDVSGLENLPRSGPAIVTPNHLHLADPPILSGVLPRAIHYMVKQEAWDSLLMGVIVRGFGAFPVRRGEVDVGSYRTALKLLEEGRVVGIFPEGHRSKDGRLQRVRPGAIFLAIRSGAPIIPIGMYGVREVLRVPGVIHRNTIRIRVGEPYYPAASRGGDIGELNAELTQRIAALLPPEHGPRAASSSRPSATEPGK